MKLSRQRLKEIIKEEIGHLEEAPPEDRQPGPISQAARLTRRAAADHEGLGLSGQFHPDKALEYLRTTAQSIGNLGEAASIMFPGYDKDHPLYKIVHSEEAGLFAAARYLEKLTKDLEAALEDRSQSTRRRDRWTRGDWDGPQSGR